MPDIVERSAQPYVALRRHVTPDSFADACDRGFPVLAAWLTEQDMAPCGPAFIRYLMIDAPRAFIVELGFPVDDLVAGDHEVRGDVLPEGRWLVDEHVGPYWGLPAAHARFDVYAAENGLSFDRHGSMWHARLERYVVDLMSESDSSRWRTELACLLED